MRFSSWSRVAVFSCGSELLALPWDYEAPALGPYSTLCRYEPAFGSWASCVRSVTNETAMHWFNIVCSKAGGYEQQISEENIDASYHNASRYLESNSTAWAPSQKLHRPVRIDQWTLDRKVNAVHAEFANLDRSNDSVLWIYYYFIVLLISLLALQNRSVRKMFLTSPVVTKIRSRMTIPTLWGKHTQYTFWGLVPNALETCILLGLATVHLFSLTFGYITDPNEVLEPVSYQRLQILGNRSGIVSFGLLPLVIVLSARSQFFLPGLKYTTIVALHRWIGRAIVADALIHTAAFYAHASLTGELEMASRTTWWVWGVCATWIGVFIAVLAMFRRWFYEVFLYTHIALSIAFFYLCWVHVEIFGWTYWIWAACALWAVERLYRLALVARHGVCEAECIRVNESFLMLRIQKPQTWHMQPAQYAFIYFLLPGVFWQSHPFTVVDMEDELRAVISVKHGVTKALQKREGTKFKVLLEGPYGPSHSFADSLFDQVLLISGGSGIPGPLAIAKNLNSLVSGPSVRLILVVRDLEILNVFGQLPADAEVYYTGHHCSPYPKKRPDVLQLIENLKGTHSAVVCCGPPALNDLTRDVVARVMREDPESVIEYFEEYQIW